MLYLFTQQMSYTTRHNFELRWPAFDADPCKQLKPVSKFWKWSLPERRLVFAYHFPFQELHVRPRSGGATLGSQLSGTEAA